ncbi:MAG: DEAD/DEAH box helicase, partial [Pirellulales bacterium]|nr:DEAD/DEAH box helicase [Pirellulales bacterium]
MGLSKAMLASLNEAEYLDPTPIQAGLIPRAIEGVDLMGQAQTGTGKTAAFCIPILERLQSRSEALWVQALVLLPTRELAVQVRDECVKLASGRDVRVTAVYGGKPIRKQVEQLRRGTEIVVGTPGRIMDLMNRGSLVLGEVRFVVLDEADRMLDIGFRPDIEKILRRCPRTRQTLLLSATIPPPVKRLAERYMNEPEMVDFSTKDLAVETIEQWYFTVDAERKYGLLVKLLEREKPRQAIVFCRTKRGTDKVSRRLSQSFRDVDTIHGDLQQRTRDRVMSGFREGKIKVLAATDVVGRGIDVTSISHIINYDIPQFCDDYVHRVGRTGRMGREGIAFTFVTPEEGNELTRIEMRINLLLKRDEIPGFVALSKPQPTDDFDVEGDEPLE